MAPASPIAATKAPEKIRACGFRFSLGIRPHCAAKVADAPAIITIAIEASDPCGSRLRRSITKKPMQVKVAACAWPAATPAMIQDRTRESFHLNLLPLGDVAATTLAPVGWEAPEG